MNINTVADSKLATITGVDLNTAVKTALYTVPTGKTLIVTKVIIRGASISLTTASFSFGFGAGANDVIATETYVELTGATLYTKRSSMDGAKLGVAADIFGVICSILQGAPATATIDVFGYLV